MPHLTILYTADLDAGADMATLCRSLAATLRSIVGDDGQPVFPVAGIRVLAYPAAHAAVADGSEEPGFAYLHLRMARGRPDAVKARAGDALAATARAHFASVLASRPVGVTLQVDEGGEVFDAKLGNLHALFAKA